VLPNPLTPTLSRIGKGARVQAVLSGRRLLRVRR
jgi:hypothetical protein